MDEYKLYKVRYVDAGTEEYYCEVYRISNDIDSLKAEYEKDKDIENVKVEEVKFEGFKIKIEKE